MAISASANAQVAASLPSRKALNRCFFVCVHLGFILVFECNRGLQYIEFSFQRCLAHSIYNIRNKK